MDDNEFEKIIEEIKEKFTKNMQHKTVLLDRSDAGAVTKSKVVAGGIEVLEALKSSFPRKGFEVLEEEIDNQIKNHRNRLQSLCLED